MFARLEKVARGSVAKGLVDGLYDLGGTLERQRAGALRSVPREVRGRIRAELDARLDDAGITRVQAREVVARLEDVRVFGRSTMGALRRLG